MQMIDVLQKLREIAERSPEEISRAIASAEAMSGKAVAEAKGSKPDYIDLDKDGNKTEPMAKAAKDAKSKKKKVGEDDETDASLAKVNAIASDLKSMTNPPKMPHVNDPGTPDMFKIDEDVQITLTGSDAVLAEILKLAGQIGAKTSGNPTPVSAAPAPIEPPKPMGMPPSGPIPSLDSMLGDKIGMEDEILGDSFGDATTTPDPVTMGMDAAIPSGDDLAKEKLTAPKVSPGDNPLQTARSF